MANSYNNLLRLTELGNGDQSGTWGATTNQNLGTLICEAIAGFESVTVSATPYTLTAFDGVADQSRNAVIGLTGDPGSNATIVIRDTSKVYIFKNEMSNSRTATIQRSSGGDSVTIPADATMMVYCDGSGVYESVTNLPSGATIGGAAIVTEAGTQTLSNKTLTAPKFADGGFIADANGNEIVVLDTVASAVNEVTVANAATGSGPSISTTGSDTNIDLLLVAKGTGVVKADGVEVVTLSGTQTLTNKTLTAAKIVDDGFIADANGNELIVGGTTASAVNEIKISNAATGNNPVIEAQGDDTDVGLEITTKGDGILTYNGTEVATTTTASNVTENAQTGTTYTLALSDAGKLVTMSNSSSNTLTVPPNSSVAFPIGSRVDLVQYGSGQTTISAGGVGVEIRSFDGNNKLSGQYAGATLWKRGENEWVLIGNTTS